MHPKSETHFWGALYIWIAPADNYQRGVLLKEIYPVVISEICPFSIATV